MFTKLKLKNFKNFREAEISLGPVSVIIGANASGKSNVRDALRFIHGIARGYNLAEIIGEKYAEGGYQQWSGIRGGTREVCFRGSQEFTVELDFESPKDKDWPYTYAITVNCGETGRAPRVTKESLYVFGIPVFDSHPKSDYIPDQNDHLHLNVKLPIGENWRKSGPVISALANQPVLTQAVELAEHKEADYKIREAVNETIQVLESMRFIDFNPDAMRKPSVPGQVVLSDRGENLSSVLQSICENPALKGTLSNWIQELTPMDVVDFDFVPDSQGRILVHLIEEGGRRTSANSASDGTLRFLGILAALLGPKPAHFYFLEELDNGIHPARLTLLMDLLESNSKARGVQILATTHSPQVLRLIRKENLKNATLAYRLRDASEGKMKSLSDIPHLLEILQKQDLARLHETSWMEHTMQFQEGKPKEIELEPAKDS
ncbi:MAG TPA: ATP-binding protein [Candidatus Sulfotelmatobacter sp.]|nr:ATP-binding protein [Candidatus Sulfotelmatobacter sp.]